MTHRRRIAVPVSGRGSNLQALIDAAKAPDYPASIALVLSNKPDAYALERARAAGIATETVEHKDFPTRETFDNAMHKILLSYRIDFVCLAGFMRILTPGFVRQWDRKMINIHPSLLPKFKGLHTHQAALDAGGTEHGCTVHWVTPDLDSGPMVGQIRVPVLPGDTAEILGARVLEEENRLYPTALRAVLSGLV